MASYALVTALGGALAAGQVASAAATSPGDAGLALIAAILCVILAVAALVRERDDASSRRFALGMAALAGACLLTYLAVSTPDSEARLVWDRARLAAAGPIAGCWLAFSLSYGRKGARQLTGRWRWVVLATVLVPLLVCAVSPPYQAQSPGPESLLTAAGCLAEIGANLVGHVELRGKAKAVEAFAVTPA